MNSLEKEQLRKKLRHYTKKGYFKDKKILLYGGSRHLKGMRECLSADGIPIFGVIDKDSRKSGTEYMGIPIGLPEELLLPYDNNIVVLILSNRYYREMAAQLTSMKYVRNRHFFILNSVIGTKKDESMKSVLHMFIKNRKGLSAYRKLTGSTGKTVFVIPFNGSGNVYVAGLFFQEYVKRHNIQDYVFVVVSDMCRRVAEMFDIKNIIVMDAGLVEDMIRCSLFMRAEWNLVVLHDGWRSDITRWLKGYGGLDFEKFLRYFSFDFDDKVPRRFPVRRECADEITELFEQYGLQKGKTVVLAPYANTLFEYHDSFWKAIVRNCTKLGYSVCTNCASAAEKPVEGTVPIFFSFAQAVDFLEAAGCFIGLRSGLCDIISSARCIKVILYEKGGIAYYSSAYEYFSLKNMGLCDDVLEIEYNGEREKELLEEIFGVFGKV